MNIPWTLAALLAPVSVSMATKTPIPEEEQTSKISVTHSYTWNSQTEPLVKHRVSELDLPLQVVPEVLTMKRIKQYVTAGKPDMERVMGRSLLFFPIFEHYLAKYELPETLKYLAVIESGLYPDIRSGAGAAGLWQLMPATARHYGLTVNSVVDERLDVHKSTEAAVRLLRDLHQQFDDWGVVLAAYNGGGGRLRQAIRNSGTKNYWAMLDHLPVETRQYVPAYIAAAYTFNHAADHGLAPALELFPMSELRVISLNRKVTFSQISAITGMEITEIERLNPAYRKGYVPASKKGHYLTLPAPAINLLRENQEYSAPAPDNTVPTSYTVSREDSLEQIAAMFELDINSIKRWNGLVTDRLAPNQDLVLHLSPDYLLAHA